MHFRRVCGMVVIVGSVLCSVFMVMDFAALAVGMFMNMLMEVFVGMGVGVLVTVFHSIMRVFMGMSVQVFMGVEMLMLVLSFHLRLL
ncbi:MAG: hypothetical protein ACP5IL_00215 [Syntrophobacteraceae bacterium]